MFGKGVDKSPDIKFSHNYPKLWNQNSARLLDVQLIDANDINEDLREYDTKYIKNINVCYDVTTFDYDYYPLPKKGELIQLTFKGVKGIPFCTIRSRYGYDRTKKEKQDKWNYYNNLLGYWFDIVVKKDIIAEARKDLDAS